MVCCNNLYPYYFTDHLGHQISLVLQRATTSSQIPPVLQNQHKNKNHAALANSSSHPKDLHIDIPQFIDRRHFLNFDDYVDNAILSDDANDQMMRSNELLESEQYALAMVVSSEKTQHEEHNNNNDNQLENEVVGVVAEPLPREVSEAIEIPPSDGYNWRKYGQKDVKGKKFPKSYYRCTYPYCKAKKKVTFSAEGYATEIIYKDKHDHPRANPSCDLASFYLAQEMAYNLDKEADDNALRKMRLDQYIATAQMSSSSRSARQPKWVAKMVSRHDVLDDGYRWRKYGQKVVKGNSESRNYYMCTHPRCIVRKHIEKAVDDNNILLTTYEGYHNHEISTTNYNINNNLNHTTIDDFSFNHHNQANNLQFETRVEAPTMENQERFMRFEYPNPLNTVHAETISMKQYPQPNSAFRPITMPYVGLHGHLELREVMPTLPNVECTQELNVSSSSNTQLLMRGNVLEGYGSTMTMAPPQWRQM